MRVRDIQGLLTSIKYKYYVQTSLLNGSLPGVLEREGPVSSTGTYLRNVPENIRRHYTVLLGNKASCPDLSLKPGLWLGLRCLSMQVRAS